jgi:hypothetical protein
MKPVDRISRGAHVRGVVRSCLARVVEVKILYMDWGNIGKESVRSAQVRPGAGEGRQNLP